VTQKTPYRVGMQRHPAPPIAPADSSGLVRVSKLLAERGFCSRREADLYIEQGLVLVDGKVVTELGTRAYPSQTVSLAQGAQLQQAQRLTVILNKPVGYVSHADDDKAYPEAVTLITPENEWKEAPASHSGPVVTSKLSGQRGDLRSRGGPATGARLNTRGLAPAGRLDIDSTGMLVLTQDGRIARLLIGEDSPLEKEYLVRVQGRLSPEGLALLNHGLSLDGKALKPAKVSWQNEDQLRFALREGKKRQIRRMCELVGLKVVGLRRIRIGRIMLGNLPVGQWRRLGASEKF
jgi:23S rRNA pseudouridine2604 synthase